MGKLFTNISSAENLFPAWRKFSRGKKQKLDVQDFFHNLEENVFELEDRLKSGNYSHDNYKTFTVCDPKPRTINKSSVKDRLIHQALVQKIEPIFEKNFIYDSYANRKGKGVHTAVNRFRDLAWRLSQNDTKTVYVLQLDVKNFFDSVDHEILAELIQNRISDRRVNKLCLEIIDSYRSSKGRGLPLGNLTSQLFSNIYLNRLDQWIKRELRVKNYLRYADDITIMSRDRSYLVEIIQKIRRFLAEKLELELQQYKTKIRSWTQGVDFLGYIIFPRFTLLRVNTGKRIKRRVKFMLEKYKKGNIKKSKVKETITSYLGILSHSDNEQMKEDLQAIKQSIKT